MDLQKEDIPVLDFLLDKLCNKRDQIFFDNLSEIEKYKKHEQKKLIIEFKRLIYFFEYFNCGVLKRAKPDLVWIEQNSATLSFMYSGGFESAYKKLENESEDIQLEKDLKKLQKENLEYSKTIRDQESRIRNLNEELKFMSLIKKYSWFIGACIGLGLILRGFLDKL